MPWRDDNCKLFDSETGAIELSMLPKLNIACVSWRRVANYRIDDSSEAKINPMGLGGRGKTKNVNIEIEGTSAVMKGTPRTGRL